MTRRFKFVNSIKNTRVKINTFIWRLLGLSIGNKSTIHPKAILKSFFRIKIGSNCHVDEFSVIQAGKDGIEIGSNVGINPGTIIYGNVKIGNDCMIAPNTSLIGGNHNFTRIDIPMKKQGGNIKGIIIEDDVWLGVNSCILDGVIIKRGTIVGAGAVVTKNTEEYSIVGGVPARKIKSRLD